jgi:hypothetical protein
MRKIWGITYGCSTFHVKNGIHILYEPIFAWREVRENVKATIRDLDERSWEFLLPKRTYIT